MFQKKNMSLTKRSRRSLAGLFLLCLFLLAPFGPAKADISQMPLFVTARVDPNIMFVIDDSGSMMWETMPDDLTYSFYSNNVNQLLFWLFPAVYKLHGNEYFDTTNGNWNRIPLFRLDNNGNVSNFAAQVRSVNNNAVYYNPAVTYRPWLNADGTEMSNANPAAAVNRPLYDGTVTGLTNHGTRNLTTSFTHGRWWRDNGTTLNTNITVFPATYYHYDGVGDVHQAGSYSHVEIRSVNAPFVGHGRENRTDCANALSNQPSCTYDEEIQNFANWYSYHRNRIFTARGGIGQAFADLDGNVRVGYGAINYRRASTGTLDGVDGQRTVMRGVRNFEGSHRQDFYRDLYESSIPADGTPLRRALEGAGQYFSRKDVQGPWSCTPGVATPGEDSKDHLTCRQSFTILMTDGYATGGSGYEASAASRRDNTDGKKDQNTTNKHPDGVVFDFTYDPIDPFKDSFSNTLADVAMYYWKRDLRDDLHNRVPVTPQNPAFWQHMVTFGIGLGVTGTIDPDEAWQAIAAKTEVAWPAPDYTFSNCGDGPAGTCAARIDDLLHAAVNSRGEFFSASEPDVFAARLSETLQSLMARTVGTAAAIAANSTRMADGAMIYQAKFNSTDWSGELVSYLLDSETGGVDKVEWTTDTSGKIPAHAARKVFTWNGATGLAFRESDWGTLAASQRVALQAGGAEQQGKDRLNWIRGDQSKEIGQSGGYLRQRNKILGDIVNSDPMVVGALNFGYDKLPSGTPGQETYSAFVEANKARTRMVYVGANDGMLHAFNAETGSEVFTYVPAGVYHNLAQLTDPAYNHRYFVDGSPIVTDAYIDNQWRTILIGTLAGGGRSVFALDVTDPDNFTASNVLWEFTHPELGHTFGKPMVGRMATGHWGVVFGNGYGSGSGTARLFALDVANGSVLKIIDTEVGGSNGLSEPALLTNVSRTVTAVYAGDLRGNLWKFDLSGSNANNISWEVAYKQGSTPRPLFTARSAAGNEQPVTAPLEIGLSATENPMIYFGTGKYFEVGDNVVGNNPEIQTFYGIEDTGSRITATDRSVLVQQTILAEVEQDDVIWRVTSLQPDAAFTGKRGWYMDLAFPAGQGGGERVVSVPLLRHGRVIFTTLIPSQDPCLTGGYSWLMELDARTGSRVGYEVFDVNRDGRIDAADVVFWGEGNVNNPSGMRVDGIIRTGAVITAGETEFKYFGKSDAELLVVQEPTDPEGGFGRRSWRQLR